MLILSLFVILTFFHYYGGGFRQGHLEGLTSYEVMVHQHGMNIWAGQGGQAQETGCGKSLILST
jgi:hypothetical protein